MKTLTVVLLGRDDCRWGYLLREVAYTLTAVVSEDPSNWSDISECWPRYRTPIVPETVDELPIERGNYAQVRNLLEQSESWIVLDLPQKRVLSGGEMGGIELDCDFVVAARESGRCKYSVRINLPPWWGIFEGCDLQSLDQRADRELPIPRVDRDILFGEPLLSDFANRIADKFVSKSWKRNKASDDSRARYRFTIAVHREWLMTPREDLGGRIPRQLLHGARDWLEQLTEAQRIRYQQGLDIHALPATFSNFDQAPMGMEEMVIYFDLCRELIESGWNWCMQAAPHAVAKSDCDQTHRSLMAYLAEARDRWLSSPFEGDSPPSFVIECSRRRVPLGSGISIVGLAQADATEHSGDCNCPICVMMASGRFGPCFEFFDGHHLELDGEFAFSMYEDRAEWEEEQALLA